MHWIRPLDHLVHCLAAALQSLMQTSFTTFATREPFSWRCQGANLSPPTCKPHILPFSYSPFPNTYLQAKGDNTGVSFNALDFPFYRETLLSFSPPVIFLLDVCSVDLKMTCLPVHVYLLFCYDFLVSQNNPIPP